MMLRLFVGRSRCTQYAINSISTVSQCPCNQISRSSRAVTLLRGIRTGNAGRRCQHVCRSVYFAHSRSSLINNTLAFSYLRYCRLRAHFYHTSPVSQLANKYDGSKSDEADAAVPPSSGKLNVESEGADNDDPEIASILQDMNEDFSAGLAVNEIDLEKHTGAHNESDTFVESEQKGDNHEEESLSEAVSTEESEPIDIDKELLKYDYEEFDIYFEPLEEEPEEPTYPISLERGECGVFDVSELVTVLRDENGRDICVMTVPPAVNYVDHLVVVTGRSTRHIRALAEYVRWLYKKKRGRHDPLTCKIEGIDTCKDWYAMDLGNIAVHFFLKATRDTYDLETLWTVGKEYDDKIHEATSDPFATLFTHEDFLAKFPQSENKEQQPEQVKVNTVAPDVEISETPTETVYEGMENIAGWHDIVSEGRKEGEKKT